MHERRLGALTRGHRMKCLLRRMLDPNEFLSEYGIRSLSKYHKEHPYRLLVHDEEKVVNYEPAESQTAIFGGNSNWRGPVWFPVNYLLIESLQQFHHYYGDDFKVECPTGSGTYLTLNEIANELSNRLIKLWLVMKKVSDLFCALQPEHSMPRPIQSSIGSTSTSMATTAAAWARLIKPAGPRSLPS
jgi:Mannosyl oligosaccharide glucosidase.